ncbi:MAG: DUF4258 domain-containing protein [Nanoarchaeota archaeon]|nr:DUF4258 domain-containing protein [Nanoarchaeota archaeon]
MKIIFTKHAEEQMKERKIEKLLVEETIKYADKTRKEGKNKYYARRKINGFTLEVVYTRENYIKVITIYPL